MIGSPLLLGLRTEQKLQGAALGEIPMIEPAVVEWLCSTFMKKPAGKTLAGRSHSSVHLFSAGTSCLINTLNSDEFGAVGALHVDDLVGAIRGGIVKVGHDEGILYVIGMRHSFPCSVDQIRGACGVI
jgi:hypothetical protein